MNERVKVSVFLPEDVHRRLKLASVNRGTSIQKAMEDAAHAWIEPKSAPPTRMSSKEIRRWQAKLRGILESGDPLAMSNCTAGIAAMEAYLKERRNRDASEEGKPAVNLSGGSQQLLRKVG